MMQNQQKYCVKLEKNVDRKTLRNIKGSKTKTNQKLDKRPISTYKYVNRLMNNPESERRTWRYEYCDNCGANSNSDSRMIGMGVSTSY